MREAMVMVAVAAKGMGKTHTSANDIIGPQLLPNPKTGAPGRKVLIFDTNGEYTDKKLQEKFKVSWRAKPLSLNDLQAWTMSGKVEARRILALDKSNRITEDVDEMLEILYTILKTFRNGMLVLDDINAYLIDASSKKVISSLTRNRHKNLDILIHYQTFRAIPPRVWGNLSIVRFHKTNENVSTVDAKIPNPELFYIAESLVNYQFKSGNRRFHCFVESQEDKIYGQFSLNNYRLACYIYLLNYQPLMLKHAINRFGNTKEGVEKAQKHCILDLEKYYGN